MEAIKAILTAFPALLCTLGAFGLILLLARLKVPLWAAVVAGTAALAVAFRIPPTQAARAALTGAIRPVTLGLVVITVLLLALSQTMRSAGQLEQIVSLARMLLRRPAVAMAALPALIGLLPMPGGALFSAPMVESAAGQTRVSGGRLSAINYWYRHIWEHWWPLYPGVVLATSLTRSTLGAFIAFQVPLGVFMAASGVLIFRRAHPDLHVTAAAPAKGTALKLLGATSSIWVIMLVWAAGSAALKALPQGALPDSFRKDAAKFVPIGLGLLVSLIWTARLNRLGGRGLAKVMATRSIYAMVGLVVAVMVFQYMLEDAEAARRIAAELSRQRIPVTLVVAVLPFVAGMVTGLAIGFVGVSFPIVVGLVAAMPGEVPLRPYAVLAYGCGHLGMMLSPLHLCHVVSNRYFNTTFGPVYRRILPPAAVLAALVGGYFAALRTILAAR
ncbi:MAG: hypothetical protein AMK72_03100 [Planctomycetes bacterium SM23_25]|nr:MAG: hypothetical protein AMK72_03100 [Planctomycetes bacterium SM23_25]